MTRPLWNLRLLVLVSLCACGPEGFSSGPETQTRAPFSLSFGTPEAMATSLRIQGLRVDAVSATTPVPAHGEYPCRNSMGPTCMNLSAQSIVSLPGLCTSDALPIGVWNFNFELFSGANCSGEFLNSASKVPLQCFDSEDIFTRMFPNSSVGRWVDSLDANQGTLLCAVGRVGWLQAPSNGTTGLFLSSAVVQTEDAFGQPQNVAGRLVSLAVASGPGGFSSNSVTTATTDALGRASFSQLALTTSGTYTLKASSARLLPDLSASFQVQSNVLEYSAVGPVAVRDSNGNVTVTYPTGTSVNDLLLLVEVNAKDAPITNPSGWTLTADEKTGSPARFRFTVWRKLAGTETSVVLKVDTDRQGASAWVVRYRRPRGYPPNPVLATSSIPEGLAGTVASLTPSPNLSTNLANAVVMSIVAIRSANGLSLSSAQGFSVRLSEASTQNTPTRLAIADKVEAVSGTTVASPTWTQTGTAAQWAFLTIAFQ